MKEFKGNKSGWAGDMRRLDPGIESLAPALSCQPQDEGLERQKSEVVKGILN